MFDMKKKIIISLALIAVLALATVSYKAVAGNSITEKVYAHLETVGYTHNDIEDIQVKHSFINKALGYNEWRIFVEFRKAPDIIFAFTYRDNRIIRQGIKSNVARLGKEEIYEYDRRFDNGELKNG